jgi:hypothetical protein
MILDLGKGIAICLLATWSAATPAVATVTNKTHHWPAALAPVLVACLILFTFGGTATAIASPREATLRLVPLEATVKQGETIRLRVVSVGGEDETTLILPMGADASGIITYRVTEIGSGREWTAANLDLRSFAADSRRRLPVGGSIELLHDTLGFQGPNDPDPRSLPAGRYRIVCTYDEGRTFSPENRTSRVLRSEPVEVVVTAR